MKSLIILSLFFTTSAFALDCNPKQMPKSISSMEPLKKRDILKDLEKEVLLQYYLYEIVNAQDDLNAYQLYLALEEKNDSPEKARALYQYLGVKAQVNRPDFHNIDQDEVCRVAKKLENYKP